MRVLAFFNDMKSKNKVKKVGKKQTIKKIKKMEEEKIESLPVEPETVLPAESSTTGQEVKITSFDGDFGRQDINQLRDKVNEIIAFINK